MREIQDFTRGPIFGPFVRFAIPVLLALLLQTAYGAVDLLIVGQFATSADVSAVSTGSQLMQVVTVLVNGLAMGLTIVVAREIGAGFPEKAGQIIGSGIWLFIIVTVIMTAGAVSCAGLLASLLQAPPEALEGTTAYIAICSAGTVCIVGYNLIGSIFRGIGDSTLPLVTVGIACAINIIADLILVAGFDMGASGAAIATVFAQAMSVWISLILIRRRKLPFEFSMRFIRRDSRNIRQILRLGTPVAVQDVLSSASFLIILAIVNGLGLVASAGVGVAEKLCGFLMLVPSAYMQSMSSFVAQNIGAAKPERARKALGYAVLSAAAVGIGLAWLGWFYGTEMSALFAREADVIDASAEYLKAYAIDCMLTPIKFCLMGYFNGYGKTTFVMAEGLIGSFLVRIPVSWYMSLQQSVSLFRIGLAIPASSVLEIILCLIYYIWLKKQPLSRLTGAAR